MGPSSDEASLFDKCLLILVIAAIAGVILISADLVTAGIDSKKPSDCQEGLDCPPSEHASDNAKPPSSIPAGIARTRTMGPDSCASPFVYRAEPGGDGSPATSKCVLEQDAVLTGTVELSSFTTVDCQGYKLSPSSIGTIVNISTNVSNFNTSNPNQVGLTATNVATRNPLQAVKYVEVTRASPDLAIALLPGTKGATIQNCIIEGFDFGIFALNSKLSDEAKGNPAILAQLRNNIINNTIRTRYYNIQLMNFDNAYVRDNDMVFTSPGGVGLDVERNSDLNSLKNNRIVQNMTLAIDPAPLVPGGSDPILFNNLAVGAIVAQIGGSPSLANAVIGTTLYQMSANDTDVSEDNLMEANTFLSDFVDPLSPSAFAGFASSQAVRTTIRGNNVTSPKTLVQGLIVNTVVNASRAFPGKCTMNATRLCLTNFDCNLPGVDNGSQGTCVNISNVVVFWDSPNATVENNAVIGKFSVGGIRINNALNPIVRGNLVTISGGNSSSTTQRSGILLVGKNTIETATVTLNNVSSSSNALAFIRTMGMVAAGQTASFFGSRISLNDFTNYFNAVIATNDYTIANNLTSNLSFNGSGNYWGLPCPGFNASKVRFENGAVNPAVVDNHPYNVSVASTPAVSLPGTCQ